MKTITAKAKAFSTESARQYRFMVDADGTVRVWDDVAGYYTTCHIISERVRRRLVRLAGQS